MEHLRTILADRPRDLLLLELIIQTGAPVVHLLRLKVASLLGLRSGDRISTNLYSKSNARDIVINQRVVEIFCRYVKKFNPEKEDYLFYSQKGDGPLTPQSTSRIIKGWFRRAGLKEFQGARSLKKIWELQSRQSNQKRSGMTGSKVLKPIIQTPTIQKTVLSQIEQAILSGKIAPGEQIIAEKFAREMGISRMPVREALGRLEARGFIISQKGGMIVNELSRENLLEIVEVRLLLETTAVHAAVPRRSEDSLVKLELIYNDLSQATFRNDVDETLKLNREFHRVLYHDARKPYLLSLIEDGWNRISPYFHILLRQVKNYDEAYDIKLHYRMLEGMKRRDTEEVCKWLEFDIQGAARLITSFFDQKITT